MTFLDLLLFVAFWTALLVIGGVWADRIEKGNPR